MRKVIHIPIYTDIVVFYIEDTIKEAVSKMDKDYQLEDRSDYNMLGLTSVITSSKLEREHIAICIEYTSKASTYCHECLHVAYYILDSKGITCPKSNHEPLAYLMSYLIDEVEKYMKHGTTSTKSNKELK